MIYSGHKPLRLVEFSVNSSKFNSISFFRGLSSKKISYHIIRGHIRGQTVWIKPNQHYCQDKSGVCDKRNMGTETKTVIRSISEIKNNFISFFLY